MNPIESARENQLRCAEEYLDESNSDSERCGAWLGAFDYFAEEFLLVYGRQK